MDEMLRSGIDMLVETLGGGRVITYTRSSDSVSFPAVVGKTVFRLDVGYGVTERVESRDYLFDAGLLVLDGNSVRPESGDTISETQGGKVCTYEVMAPGGEPAWRFSDRNNLIMRVHTKLVSEV